jgi:hypothetical protein
MNNHLKIIVGALGKQAPVNIACCAKASWHLVCACKATIMTGIPVNLPVNLSTIAARVGRAAEAPGGIDAYFLRNSATRDFGTGVFFDREFGAEGHDHER